METEHGIKRLTKEDATISENDPNAKAMLFGVLDGHGGRQVSRFAAKFFSQIMKNLDTYRKEKYDQALIETFIKMDELLKHEKIDLLLRNNDIDHLSNSQILQVNTTIENESNLSFEKKESSFERQKLNKSGSPRKEFNNLASTMPIPLESKMVNYNITFYNNWDRSEEEKEYKGKLKSPSTKLEDHLMTEEKNFTLDRKPSAHREIDIEKLVAFSMGTTANIILIRNKVFYIANVGDSRAVLYKGGKAIRLNEEHKPSLVSEQSRIAKSGFKIIANRIDGKLNLTRAIGIHLLIKVTLCSKETIT